MTSWRLPQGITDLPFEQATQLNKISNQLITHYQEQGYQLVFPPIIEYESSQGNTKAFKTLDPADGNMLAVHYDITPQIARIDAKYHQNNSIMRYCYVENILTTTSDDFYSSRNPIQVGIELYGSQDISADIEIIQLMFDTLKQLGFNKDMLISLGHLGIFNALVKPMNLSNEQLEQLKSIFSRRSKPDLILFCANNNTQIVFKEELIDLMNYQGEIDVLNQAKIRYAHINEIVDIINTLKVVTKQLTAYNIKLHIDLAELKTQTYYTGLLFACYHQDYSKALAQGGRYDGLRKETELFRFATGFSLDLKFLTSHSLPNKTLN